MMTNVRPSLFLSVVLIPFSHTHILIPCPPFQYHRMMATATSSNLDQNCSLQKWKIFRFAENQNRVDVMYLSISKVSTESGSFDSICFADSKPNQKEDMKSRGNEFKWISVQTRHKTTVEINKKTKLGELVSLFILRL